MVNKNSDDVAANALKIKKDESHRFIVLPITKFAAEATPGPPATFRWSAEK